jgi:hypothetical protein
MLINRLQNHALSQEETGDPRADVCALCASHQPSAGDDLLK